MDCLARYFKKDTKIVGCATVFYTNMYTGQEESVTGIVIINNEKVGRLFVKIVIVFTQNREWEIPDFCIAPKSQHLLQGVA